MQTDPKTGRVTATVDELAVYNMLLLQAVMELLIERGMLENGEVRERVKKLRDEITVELRKAQ